MKHAVIFAHPSAESFTASVAGAYASAAEALGHQVLRRDLYRMNFDPCLKLEELPHGAFKPGPDVVAERQMLSDVEVFAFVYPLWLNTPPAIMKGYMERVFGFGFAYGGTGNSGTPLLKGRKLIRFSSSGAPQHWLAETGAQDAMHALFDRYFSQLCGMTALEHVHVGGMVPGASSFFVQARLKDVEKTVNQHFGAKT